MIFPVQNTMTFYSLLIAPPPEIVIRDQQLETNAALVLLTVVPAVKLSHMRILGTQL